MNRLSDGTMVHCCDPLSRTHCKLRVLIYSLLAQSNWGVDSVKDVQNRMIGLCKTQTIDENLCVWLEVLNVSRKISITLNSPPRSECLFNACLSAPFKNVSLVSPENEFNDSSGSFVIFALCSFFTLESSLNFSRVCGEQSERQTLLLMLFFAIWHLTLIFREMSSSRQSKKSTRGGMRSRAPSSSSYCKGEKMS